MKNKIRRKRYFIHPSSQIKYILMSILPALIMTIFCIQILINSGQDILVKEKEAFVKQNALLGRKVEESVLDLTESNYSDEAVTTISDLLEELISSRTRFEMAHFRVVRKWAETQMMIFSLAFFMLLGTGIISLMYSHRIAGPIYRLRRYINMLGEDKDIPPIRLRRYDEFKELADSLEKLRKHLKTKGVLVHKVKE